MGEKSLNISKNNNNNILNNELRLVEILKNNIKWNLAIHKGRYDPENFKFLSSVNLKKKVILKKIPKKKTKKKAKKENKKEPKKNKNGQEKNSFVKSCKKTLKVKKYPSKKLLLNI